MNDPTPRALGLIADKRIKLEKALMAAARREYYRFQLRRPYFYLLKLRYRILSFFIELRMFAFRLNLKFRDYAHDAHFMDNYSVWTGREKPNDQIHRNCEAVSGAMPS